MYYNFDEIRAQKEPGDFGSNFFNSGKDIV